MSDHYKVLDQSGARSYNSGSEGIGDTGFLSDGLADAAIAVSSINATGGLLLAKTETDSALFALINTGGTIAPQILGTQALFTTSKDTASKINVYVEDGVVQVQNNSGDAIDLVLKSFV